jgi:hypothetical protein
LAWVSLIQAVTISGLAPASSAARVPPVKLSHQGAMVTGGDPGDEFRLLGGQLARRQPVGSVGYRHRQTPTRFLRRLSGNRFTPISDFSKSRPVLLNQNGQPALSAASTVARHIQYAQSIPARGVFRRRHPRSARRAGHPKAMEKFLTEC